uniref:Uncharacterized protein n=1 Tax=Physcomitrium patens TaxID=3218 RepID=A0A2K1KAH2_PHYPA|nr:hypothetical protein PHYPA_009966 [Physcomitrium patens]
MRSKVNNKVRSTAKEALTQSNIKKNAEKKDVTTSGQLREPERKRVRSIYTYKYKYRGRPRIIGIYIYFRQLCSFLRPPIRSFVGR